MTARVMDFQMNCIINKYLDENRLSNNSKGLFSKPWKKVHLEIQNNTWFWRQHSHYASQQIFTIGGASWTLDPSMEAVNCKIKLANNKFILCNIFAYNNFIWTKKWRIVVIEIWIIETYYSLLKSHLAVQICTVSFVEYLEKKWKL